MKATIKREIEVDIKWIEVEAEVRYGTDDMPEDYPGRSGDLWNAKIDIETGKIDGHPSGKPLDMHMKVCDCGSYRLLDENGEEIAALRDEYVPNGVIPGSYGDYIIIQIDDRGVISNWPDEPDLSDFFGN
ncbi:MAG: hypothetical protein ACX94C_07880 [Phycisphaerales bacterium]